MTKCIFCQIVLGEASAHVIWEDDNHLAVLSPYPNTLGFTVVITKSHQPSYIVELEELAYQALWHGAKEVAILLDKALGTSRCAFIAEGMGVNHAHIKVIPLHGVPKEWKPILSHLNKYNEAYQGYVCSADGPRIADSDLSTLAKRIRKSRRLR